MHTPPLSLPPFTFIMSDHTTHDLACRLADELSKLNNNVYIDDFLAPIHDALLAMFDADWKSDLGSAQNTQMRLADKTVSDLTKYLEAWFIERFGETKLGELALVRSKENRETFEYSYVFRDATAPHVLPFLRDTSIARRDTLFIHLGIMRTNGSGVLELPIAESTTPEEIIERIRKVL